MHHQISHPTGFAWLLLSRITCTPIYFFNYFWGENVVNHLSFIWCYKLSTIFTSFLIAFSFWKQRNTNNSYWKFWLPLQNHHSPCRIVFQKLWNTLSLTDSKYWLSRNMQETNVVTIFCLRKNLSSFEAFYEKKKKKSISFITFWKTFALLLFYFVLIYFYLILLLLLLFLSVCPT